MLTKKVRLIRDLDRDIFILERRLKREVSKFNKYVEDEIKKELRKHHSGCFFELQQLEIQDFDTNPRKRAPLEIKILSLNGKYLKRSGVWVKFMNEDGTEKEVEKSLLDEKIDDICADLTENLGILVKFERI